MAQGSNIVPARTINYRVYSEGNDYLGTSEVELPEITYMSDTVSGAGIAGEVELPTLGHTESMTTTLTWRTITENAVKLGAPKAHKLELYSSQQNYDASKGEVKSEQVRITLLGIPKTLSFGSLTPGEATDTEQEFEITYLKVEINKKQTIEIDKFNYKCKIGDTDYLAGVRSDLGM